MEGAGGKPAIGYLGRSWWQTCNRILLWKELVVNSQLDVPVSLY